jgi:hypothetical protein
MAMTTASCVLVTGDPSCCSSSSIRPAGVLRMQDGRVTGRTPGASFQAVTVNRLDGPMLASMAVADRSLFIRTDKHLYCIADAAH